MLKALRFVAVIMASGLWGTATSSPARQTPSPCTSIEPNPADVTLQLSMKSGQNTFHQGELITLVLGFTSNATQKYFLDTRNYDRSGRMTSEAFCLEPSSAGRDPLTDYFQSGIYGGFIGGGLGGIAMLGTSASNAEIDLNEWKVLPPGQYRLRVQSSRVERGATKDEPGSGRVYVPLWSNVIELRVIAATPEWEVEQLRVATTELDSGVYERERRGARILRFLESETATREMARRFEARAEHPPCCDLRFGLIGSPYRQLAIAGLKSAFDDPLHPITIGLIETLALLEVTTNPEYRMPPPPSTAANRDAWAAQSTRAREAYQRLVNQHVGDAMVALARKNAAAQAETVNALLQAPVSTGVDRAALKKQLISSWDSLPAGTRNELLNYRWDDLGGPDFLPILRQIVTAPAAIGRQATPQLERAPALAHLYELAPVEARELILREMKASRRTVDSLSVLTLLPDRELPEIEEPIFARLRAGQFNPTDVRLLERYGTARSLPELQRAYTVHRGRWACEQQSSALRQFIRADPSFGAAEVEYALSQRTETGCYRQLLKDLNETLSVPEIERIAVAALDDPSPEVERFAAEALGDNGSPAAENALWRRLEKFHESFKDRPDDLRSGPGFDDPRAANGMIEIALINALANGQAWFCAGDKLTRLKDLVSPLRQREATRYEAERARPEFHMQLDWPSYSSSLYYGVGGYSGQSVQRLIQKLKQFPKGTQIVCSLSAAISERHHSDLEAVQRAADDAGLLLKIDRK